MGVSVDGRLDAALVLQVRLARRTMHFINRSRRESSECPAWLRAVKA
jgi:hypothetical protein